MGLFRRSSHAPLDELLITRTGGKQSDGVLLAEGSRAVWPLNDDSAYRKVAMTTRVFGGAMTESLCVEVTEPTRLTRDNGWVVGIGDLEGEAKLYAHLTGRRSCAINGISDLTAAPTADVYLSCSPRLDDALIHELMLRERDVPVCGIVWAPDRGRLRHQVLVRAAAATLNGPTGMERVDVVGHVSTARIAAGSREQLGTAASPRALRRALAAEAGLLCVFNHGDALGFRLSEASTVCGCVDPPADADDRLGPACIDDDVCRKLNIPFKAGRRTGALIAPEHLVARVFLLMTCQAAFVGSAVLDSLWSPFPRIVTSACIGAVVATPELGTGSVQAVAKGLCATLSDGATVGEALTYHYTTDEARRLGHQFLLFGDPRTRATPLMEPGTSWNQ